MSIANRCVAQRCVLTTPGGLGERRRPSRGDATPLLRFLFLALSGRWLVLMFSRVNNSIYSFALFT